MTRDFTATQALNACSTVMPDGFIAEAEIPFQRGDGSPNPQAQDWPALISALSVFPDMDKAVATSFAPFQKYVPNAQGGRDLVPAIEIAAPLIKAGWKLMPYVYPAENKGDTVARKIAYSNHYSPANSSLLSEDDTEWLQPEPVLGAYTGVHGDFRDLDNPAFAGKEACAGFSVWDAGEHF